MGVPKPYLSPQSSATETRADVPQQVPPTVTLFLLQRGTGKDLVWEKMLAGISPWGRSSSESSPSTSSEATHAWVKIHSTN